MPKGVYKRKPLSEEHKEKIRKSLTGIKRSAEYGRNISIRQKGKPFSGVSYNRTGEKASEETKAKMRASSTHHWKGKKFSKEHTENMSIAMKERFSNKENHPRWKGGVSEDKEYLSWIKNKRNRLKLATIRELGGHTYGDWELLKKQYNYTCPCCKLSEPFNQKSKYLTEDHIIPLSKGGSDLIENIQPLCLSCNIKKHTKIIKY